MATGTLDVPVLAPGESATVPLPDAARGAAFPSTGESWYIVRCLLSADTSWAPAGHEISRGQGCLGIAPRDGTRGPTTPVDVGDGRVRVGPVTLDTGTGSLVRVGDVPVIGPRVELWRAPTDNDVGWPDTSLARRWRRLGLDRVRRRLVEVAVSDAAVRVTVRVGPVTSDVAVLAEMTWTADGDIARLGLAARAVGEWPCPLPRFGLRFDLPATLASVRWFGRGPGESYPDTGLAAGVGRFELTVDQMQTPYVMPQENGHRSDVRWAEMTGPDGRGVRIDGEPTFGLTTRRWTTERLDRATHTTELVDEGSVFVTIDVAQHGIGTASCGPGPLPRYELWAVPPEFSFLIRPLPA